MSKNICILVLLCVSLIFARDIYISQNRGNDETGTGSHIAPYRTFQKSLAVLADGDVIKAEIGIYQHSASVSGKSFSIVGIREHSKFPVFSGGFSINNAASFSMTNLEIENPSSNVWNINGVASVTLTHLNVGPCLQSGVIKKATTVEISDCVFSKTSYGPVVGVTSSEPVEAVSFKNNKFVGVARGPAISISYADRVVIEGNDVSDNCVGVSAQCGIKIFSAKNFMMTNTKVVNSETGATIESSTGAIENCVFSGNDRVYSSTGGGLYLKSSTVRTRLVTLAGNKAKTGAGFYCYGGSLNMFAGKIEGNAATGSGGAGECAGGCAFFMDQVIVRDNTQASASSCRGL